MFGVVLGVGVGLGKLGLPLLAYSNKESDSNFSAICWLLWLALVCVSAFNTTQYIKSNASKQMLESPEHKSLQADIDFKQSEIKAAIEAREEINAGVSPTAYQKATDQIKLLNDEKTEKQAQYNSLTVEDITATDFIKNQNLIGAIGAFILEMLTIVFGIGAKKEDEHILSENEKSSENSEDLTAQISLLMNEISAIKNAMSAHEVVQNNIDDTSTTKSATSQLQRSAKPKAPSAKKSLTVDDLVSLLIANEDTDLSYSAIEKKYCVSAPKISAAKKIIAGKSQDNSEKSDAQDSNIILLPTFS